MYSPSIIDVCIDIYVMMSSDLYGTCSNVDVIVMSRTNSKEDVIVTHNIATVSADIVYSICNIFHYISVTKQLFVWMSGRVLLKITHILERIKNIQLLNKLDLMKTITCN